MAYDNNNVKKIDRNKMIALALARKTPAIENEESDPVTYTFTNTKDGTIADIFLFGTKIDTFKLQKDEKDIIDNLKDNDNIQIEILEQPPFGIVIHLLINDKMVYGFHSHDESIPKFITYFFKDYIKDAKFMCKDNFVLF